jgi:shikimate kinase
MAAGRFLPDGTSASYNRLRPSAPGAIASAAAEAATSGGQDRLNRMIQLVGPGGAGKTTVGAALAERLGARFGDLDAEFAARHGDISAYLDAHGYETYAEHNVAVYLDLVGGPVRLDIVALSSGFMTYRGSIHPAYSALRQRVASSPSTFVLLPSVNVEACVGEIVRRQLRRRFARSAEREERVIRDRFFAYFGLPCRKVETMQPVEAVVAEVIAALAAQQAACRE